MIVFGVAVTRSEDYERWAGPGIDRAREPDSAVYANSSPGSIFRAYNLLLDQAADHDGLEALVLLHQDVEIVEDDFCGKVRAVLSDPEVAIVGCVGARDARTMAWWEGAVTWASFTHRYYEHGGGILPAFSMSPETQRLPAYARLGEVDTIDGFIMVLSPWAVRNLRFDETLGQFHGYDFDICMQARAAGRKVVTADLKVWHHHSLELMSDPENWVEVNVRMTEKWESRNGDGGGEDWKARARRAEAQASASNVLKISANMRAAARERELLAELQSIQSSASWRYTAPIRRLAAFARARRGRSG
ncbi:MAG: glycosyltransferase [Solirubrobacteraceae bacterium]